ncbi:MAG: monovalent cation/H+ antiporter subunit D family protein [bacterium]|nr:monovalent cation/H+ antiporter subunit D family protein [bacterium]
MSEHFPALQVVIPILAAPLCLLLRNGALARGMAIAVTLASLAISLSLLDQVRTAGPIVYAFGNWPRPLGIEYVVDLTNAFVLVIVSLIGAVVLPIGCRNSQVPAGREYLFYAAFLLCFGGLLGVAITGDTFNIFVFLEISSLATYILVAMGRDRRALMAAYSYLIVGTIGATFLLIGIGLLYQMTGTLNIADLAARLPEVRETHTVIVAFGFVMVGISIKLALLPLHQWLPNAYTYAPPVVSAFLSATATKVAYYLMLRFVFTILGGAFVFEVLHFDLILLPLSILAIFVGSTAAIYQADFKRLLAYSSIAQIGYMTLGLSLNSEAGTTAGIVHLFNHALMKGGLFLVAGCLAVRIGSTAIADMRGLGKRMPLAAFAIVVAGLGMIGVPGTVGFVSKWVLVSAALEQGRFDVTALILLSSLLALVYIWRLIEVMYLSDPPQGAERSEAPALYLVPTWILVAASVYFGFDTGDTLGVARAAAAQLVGGAG